MLNSGACRESWVVGKAAAKAPKMDVPRGVRSALSPDGPLRIGFAENDGEVGELAEIL